MRIYHEGLNSFAPEDLDVTSYLPVAHIWAFIISMQIVPDFTLTNNVQLEGAAWLILQRPLFFR